MKSKASGLLVVACVVAMVCAGCAAGPRNEAATADRKSTGQSPDGLCAWEFEKTTDGSGKLKKGTLKVTKGSCSVAADLGPPLYITADKMKFYEIKDISSVYVETDGSCRYCYINAGGGLSCVVYSC